MAVTYCTVEDVADFLRIPITATTTPNKTQVEKIINRKEEELDRRIGHTFGREKTITKEIHDLPLLYTFGWGTPLWLQHRNCKPLNSSSGDKIEIWQGASSAYDDILNDTEWYEFDEVYGRLYLRGFLFSIMRKNRVRVTYRYGDTTVPDDVEDACVKLTAIELLTTSLRMDQIPIGSNQLNIDQSIKHWKDSVEECVLNRREVFFIP
tara:strand:- start:2846 stop:3469 length:624 start_codon:yes stop_codon:yes gene_type:complete